MRLEVASYKAIKYACENFHYSKTTPVNVFGYSVFNENNEWCGIVAYGGGATFNIASKYKLKQGNVVELVRVALNGKQSCTSKALALSLKLIKNHLPLCKLVVSYADSEQNHYGTIYQATNWYFTGHSTDTNLILDGIRHHRRTLNSRYGTSSLKELSKKGFEVIKLQTKPKWKYIYPLHKSVVSLCKELSKPYPKRIANEVNEDKRNISNIETGGSIPTHSLQMKD